MEPIHVRDLIDAAPLAMALVGPGLQRIHVNRPYAELLGRPASDLEGRPVDEVVVPIDALALVDGERRMLAGEVDAADVECRLVHADGHAVPVCVLARPWRDQATGSLTILETIVDRSAVESVIEDAQTSESQLRSAMLALADIRDPRQVHDMILTMARSVMGARYAAMLLVEEDQPVDRFLHQGIDPDTVERMGPLPVGRGVLGLITADSGPVVLTDLRAHPAAVGVPPGHPVMTSFLGVPVVKDGELLARLYFANKEGRAEFDEADRQLAVALAAHAAGALVNARIHDRMARLVEELDRVNAEVEESSKRRLRFLATVAHELRTPVHSILIAAELVSDPMLGDLTEERMRELGAKIHASGKHLLGLVDDVVDLARLQSGNLALNPEPTSLDGLIREVVDATGPLARDRNVELTSADRDDVLVLVDPLRLRQVLLNLVTNAIKYTAPGGRVWLDAWATERDIRIAVHDTGVGIPAESLGRVFEPFEQLTPTGIGYGLGLTISRRLCELHGGVLEVASTVGVGSTFLVSLPGVVVAPGRDAAVRPAASRPAAPRVSVPVLVVEDDHTARELVTHVLANAGYEVSQVGSLAAAREELERSTPGLIVLDVGLGDGSGLDLARQVRAAGMTMPIAIVSANSDAQDIAEARAVGCSDYLVKPVSARELLARVHHLVALRSVASRP